MDEADRIKKCKKLDKKLKKVENRLGWQKSEVIFHANTNILSPLFGVAYWKGKRDKIIKEQKELQC